jgi:integrase
MRLTTSAARGLRVPGKYLDSHGLFLNVVTPEKRYWLFRYQRSGRERVMSLGSADVVSLADARRLHAEARALLARGVDPLAQRAQERAKAMATLSFSEASERYIEAHRAGWRGHRAAEHWRSSLTMYAAPVFGTKPVADIDLDDMIRALTPIWITKTVTATRVRNRIELVLDYARARGWRSGENPARWRGNLKMLLPPKAKVHTITHRAALPWRDAPAFMARLSCETNMGARCLAFTILTAARAGEARGARWDEIDLERRVWTIPAGRMKAGKQHRVALSEPALDILRALAEVRTGDLVFFSHIGHGLPMDGDTVSVVMRRIGYVGITVHGFRSTFAEWAADNGFPSDLAEAALAHAIGSTVARAYQRSDLLDARRGLMNAWAVFLSRPAADVVPLRALPG